MKILFNSARVNYKFNLESKKLSFDFQFERSKCLSPDSRRSQHMNCWDDCSFHQFKQSQPLHGICVRQPLTEGTEKRHDKQEANFDDKSVDLSGHWNGILALSLLKHFRRDDSLFLHCRVVIVDVGVVGNVAKCFSQLETNPDEEENSHSSCDGLIQSRFSLIFVFIRSKFPVQRFHFFGCILRT